MVRNHRPRLADDPHAARTRRLEHLTHAWLVAESPEANADQRHGNRATGD